MYYYYYYYSAIKLNFRFENKSNKSSNSIAKISIVDFEKLIRCMNLINQCAVDSALVKEINYNENDYLLRLDKISYNSPLDITVIVPLAASALGIPLLILQSIEKIIKLKLNTKKKKIEKQKLLLDINEKSKGREIISESEINKKLTTMISSKLFDKISKEMRVLPFEIIEYKVQYFNVKKHKK